MYQRVAWWQHTSACSLVPTGFKASIISSAWGTAEREAVMEMKGKCHWAHGIVGYGIREQGSSSTGGQWAGCPYQWGWRPSCRRVVKDTGTLDATNPECWCWEVLRSEASRLTLGSSWSCSCPRKAPSGRGEIGRGELGVDSEVAMGHAASPSPCTGVHCAAVLPSTSHLHPAGDYHWLLLDPHLSGARPSCLTDSPVPCLT